MQRPIESPGVAEPIEPRTRSPVDVSAWVMPFAIAGATAAAVVLLYHETFRSMASIWLSSGTYAHGFVILPISVYLIWDTRVRLAGAAARPANLALPVLALLGFGWLSCRLAGVNVLEQYLAVAMLVVSVWAVLGSDGAKRILFPLGFLFLAVPVGDALLPTLMEHTGVVTVAALRLSGIPVLQDGNSLTLPTGRWSIVEACSGLRYLIACVTVGILYAHLTFRSWFRRGLCVLASIVVPIVANWIRAYMIVMIGHLSEMRFAVGIDHLIYGWLFFGVVILVFFWVGSFFREDAALRADSTMAESDAAVASTTRLVVANLSVLVIASFWPFWAVRAQGSPTSLQMPTGELFPSRAGDFAIESREPGWSPHYENPDIAVLLSYRRENERVGLHAACYLQQTQGRELVSSVNRFVAPTSDEWRTIEETRRAVTAGGVQHPVTEARIHGPARVLAWKWFWIQGESTASPYRAKLLEFAGTLFGHPPTACGVTVFTRDLDDPAAREVLADFLAATQPSIDAGLAALSAAE